MKNLPSLENIYLVFRKEMTETLRDRRTLFVMTLLPILLYPLLMLGVTQVVIYKIGAIQKSTTKLAIEGESEYISQALENENVEILRTDNARRKVLQEKAVLGLRIPPRFDQQVEAGEDPQRVLLYYSGANDKAKILLNKIETVLQELLYRVKKEVHGHERSWTHPFQMVRKNVASSQKQGAFEFGRLLAIIIVLMAITFPLYPAIDMGAGEKERGTMETLLLCPASRSEIVLGKYVTIFAIAMVGSLLNLASMGLTFGYFAQQSGEMLTTPSSKGERYVNSQVQELYPIIAEQESTLTPKQTPLDIALFSSGDAVLTVLDDGSLPVWYLPSERKLGEIDWPLEYGKVIKVEKNQNAWFLITQEKIYKLALNWLVPTKGKTEKMVTFAVKPKYLLETFASDKAIVGTRLSSSGEFLVVTQQEGYKILLDQDLNQIALLALASEQQILDVSPQGEVLLASSQNQLAVFSPEQQQKQKTYRGHLGCFLSSHLLLLQQGENLRLMDLRQDKLLQQLASQLPPVTMLASDFAGENIFVARNKGMIQHYKLINHPEQPQLHGGEVLGGHEHEVASIDVANDSMSCVTMDEQGVIKEWTLAPPLQFSISLATIIKMLAILIPLVGLFSALCLGLSIFARSYKEGQYYLTPLVILIMPLVLVAFLPNMKLSAQLCFLPVSNVVLLYKELLLGEATPYQIALVFLSTFIYAGVALYWAVALFQKENVLFRESTIINWKFWQRKPNQVTLTPSQAGIYFLFTLVFYHMLGPLFSRGDLLFGQMAAMVFFLLGVPLLVVVLLRYQVTSAFALVSPRSWSNLGGTIAFTLGALLSAAILAFWQQQLVPIESEALKELQEKIQQVLQNRSFWLILATFALTPGICEEFFFRGLLLSSFRQKMSDHKAVVWVAVLFAIMHMDLTRLTFTFVMGVYLGILLLRTGSIVYPILAHTLSNATSITIGYFAQQENSALAKMIHKAFELFTQYPIILSIGGLVLAAVLLICAKNLFVGTKSTKEKL